MTAVLNNAEIEAINHMMEELDTDINNGVSDEESDKFLELEARPVFYNPPKNDDYTPENLDRIASAIWQDEKPMQDIEKEWKLELGRRLVAVADMFDEGQDVIVLAKLADQLPRMFEKMRDKVEDQAAPLKDRLRAARRADVGVELTQVKIDDLEEQLTKYREQYYTLNMALKSALEHARPKIISNAGFHFGDGKYTFLRDLPRVRRLSEAKKKMTMEAYRADPEHFNKLAEDIGPTPIPADQQ